MDILETKAYTKAEIFVVHLAVEVFPACRGWITRTGQQAIRQRIINKLLEAEQI